jgi:hypothetical protein
MKNVVRVLAALAVVALATPALACDGAKKQTTTAAQEKQQQKDKKAAEKATATAQAQPAKPAATQN